MPDPTLLNNADISMKLYMKCTNYEENFHDPKIEMMTLLYSHQDKSSSTQQKKWNTKIKQEQYKEVTLVHSITIPKSDCHMSKPLM